MQENARNLSLLYRLSGLMLGMMLIIAVSVINFVKADDSMTIEKEFDLIYEQLLHDPANIELTTRYAEIAMQMNDYEAAIPALERISLFNPELIEVKYRLGQMYFHLESYDMAKSYFEDVQDHADTTEQMKDKIKFYFTKMTTF